MFLKINKPVQDLENEEYLNNYGCFYKDNDLTGVGKYTSIIELVRKMIVIGIVIMLNGDLISQCVTLIVGSGVMSFWYICIFPRKSVITQLGVILCELLTLVSGFALASFRPDLSIDNVNERVNVLMITYISIPLSAAFASVAEQIIAIGKRVSIWFHGNQPINTTANN